MIITENLGKQITETAYLTQQNTKRYRPIMRFFYEQYEKMNFMLYKEDVFEALNGSLFFEDYTLEQCDSDLETLKGWKNLTAVQDTKAVYTLEEFKNKRYRYQLTDFTVEIEKLVLKLENLHIEGASLEPTLIERIKNEVQEIETIYLESETKVNGWWENLNADFKRLNDNYQGYIKSFYNIKMEDIAQSDMFIVRKNDLVLYLREFIKSLQENCYVIEEVLSRVSEEVIEEILEKVYLAQSKVIRIDKLDIEVSEKERRERNLGKWINFKRWFVGDKTHASEVVNIEEKTNEIIRKITRIANQIAESKGNANVKKAEYRKIAEMFCNTKSLDEAHKLSSLVFGVMNTRHLKGDFPRETDNINSKLSAEKPAEIIVKPRIREYRAKRDRVAIENKSFKKKEQIELYLKLQEERKKALQKYIVDDKIELAILPDMVESDVRKSLLKWISSAVQSRTYQVKIEDGSTVIVHLPKDNARCTLKCEDGNLEMPAFVLEFKWRKE